MERKTSWLAAADRYIADCQETRSAPRANELALRLNLSPVQLVRAFRASVGANVGEYLKQRQIALAQELLLTTNLPVGVIGARTGFASARSFFRAFRRATGITPSQFRHERNVSGARPPAFLD